ncbi:MAG: metalloregulator ArsR/SmtB family transcription factor [Oleiphilaceae bacterium]|nr:metalloregulator ArsR/SmtB family transcription factor [Oleiphilaceae bacterium]
MNIQALAQQFKTWSDPVRLRILACLIAREEVCVCDLIDVLQLPQSVVSRHLAYLRKHEMVASERRGTWQYYSHTLDADQLSVLEMFFSKADDISPIVEQLRQPTLANCC